MLILNITDYNILLYLYTCICIYMCAYPLGALMLMEMSGSLIKHKNIEKSLVKGKKE